MQKDWRRERKASQSVGSQQGILGIGLSDGGARVISMGTWSEPVEGRDVVSQAVKGGGHKWVGERQVDCTRSVGP